MRRAPILLLLLALALRMPVPAVAQEGSDETLMRIEPAVLDGLLLPDVSGHGRDLVLKAFEPGPASGLRGSGAANDPYALRLDGIDDELGTRSRERIPPNMTLLVWVRTEWAGAKIAGFESSENGSSTQRDRQLYLSEDGRPHWGIFASGGLVHAEERLADGEWHLLAGTVERTTQGARVALHVDGKLAAESQASSAGPDFQGYWRFSSGATGMRNASRGVFGGELGPIRIEAHPLDAAAHAEAFAAGPSGRGGWPAAGARPPRIEDGLALALDAERVENAELVDGSAFGQRVPLSTLGTGGLAPATAATGVDAIRFRGEGALQTPHRFADPDAVTMSAWFRTEQTGGKLVGFESSQNGSSTSYDRHLFMGSDGRVHFGVFTVNGTLSTRPGLADGEWHHVVGVIPSRGAPTGMRLYLDGVLVNSSSVNDKPAYSGHWRIGGGTMGWRDAFRDEYTGLLAGVRVYERALRDDEARALFARGPDGTGPPRVAAPGAATLADARALHLDPGSAGAATGLADLGPLANAAILSHVAGNATSGLTGSGTREDPYAIALDGVNDVVLTSTRVVDPDAFTLSLWFHATKPGKLIGLESSQNGSSTSYDRHLFMDDRGRLYFGIFTVNGTLHTEESYLDGQWHHAVASVGSRGGDGQGMRLYVDGELVASAPTREKPAYGGYWRAGGGTLGWANATRDPHFGGRLASILVHERALRPDEVTALHALGPGGTRGLSDLPPLAPEPIAVPLSTPTLDVDVDASGATPAFRITLAGAPTGSTVHAILPDGRELVLGASDMERWHAPERASGLYRFEARTVDAEGNVRVLAREQELVLLPLATPPQAVGAVAAGVAITTLSAFLASRGFDLLGYLRSVLTTSTADRLRDRTKDKADLARVVRIGSGAAMALALVSWALLYAAGKPGALALVPFARALFVAGLAVVAMKLLQTGILYALARSDGHGARYRFWTTGTLSLALSSLVFHVPFGYPGFLQREKPQGAPPSTPRRDGLTALATILVLATLIPVFLGLALVTSFAFAETAMAMAFAGFAVTAMPVKPMAGYAVWRWSRLASVILAGAAFALYVGFQLGALPWWSLVVLGIAAFAVVAGVAIANVAARRATTRPVEDAAAR